MGPKIESAVRFVSESGRAAVITCASPSARAFAAASARRFSVMSSTKPW